MLGKRVLHNDLSLRNAARCLGEGGGVRRISDTR